MKINDLKNELYNKYPAASDQTAQIRESFQDAKSFKKYILIVDHEYCVDIYSVTAWGNGELEFSSVVAIPADMLAAVGGN